MGAPQWKQWNATTEEWEVWPEQDLPRTETLFLHAFLLQFYNRAKYLESISGAGSLGISTLADFGLCLGNIGRKSIQSEDLWDGFYPTLAPDGWLEPKEDWDGGTGTVVADYADKLKNSSYWTTNKEWLENDMKTNEYMQFEDGTYNFRKRLLRIRAILDTYQVFVPTLQTWGGEEWNHSIDEDGTFNERIGTGTTYKSSWVLDSYGRGNQSSQHQSAYPKNVVVPSALLKGGAQLIIGYSSTNDDTYTTNPNVNGEEVTPFETACKIFNAQYTEEVDLSNDWNVHSGDYHKPGTALLPLDPDDIDPPWSHHQFDFKLVYLAEKWVEESWYPSAYRMTYPAGPY